LPLTPVATASLSDSELRALVVDLIGEVRGLRLQNAALGAENEELRATHIAVKAEVQSLRGAVARLKGLPPRPPAKPPRPSGMEKKAGKVGRPPKRRRRGPKRDAGRVDREVTLKLEDVPPGSRLQGCHKITVRNLVVAPLPAGVLGGFGPNLRRFITWGGSSPGAVHPGRACSGALSWFQQM
jgi:hypothetical protein